MSTFLPKADEITRNWYVIDAAGKPLGRVASEAAVLLTKQFTVATVRWTDAWPNDFLKKRAQAAVPKTGQWGTSSLFVALPACGSSLP